MLAVRSWIGANRCGKENKEILTDDIEAFKPDWCPLKEIKPMAE